jgi:predicted ATPase
MWPPPPLIIAAPIPPTVEAPPIPPLVEGAGERRPRHGDVLRWRDQGKRDEARDLVAAVYGWFTEGFETLDLKEAKALLDELAA